MKSSTMVIHDESELPAEVAVIKTPLFEAKSCSKHKDRKKLRKLTENELDEKVRKTRTMSKNRGSALDNYDSSSGSNSISVEDLEELKSVYKKCKAIIKKIESKYGHLLDLNKPVPCKRSGDISDSGDTECQCTMNKKIVFDDEGKEIVVDTVPNDHICPKRLKFSQSHIVETYSNLQVEYYNKDADLPDSLYELRSILRNTELEITYRNKVIEKLKRIKQEHSYDIKFNKHSIIEKAKLNADDLIDFKGANLSSLIGYIY